MLRNCRGTRITNLSAELASIGQRDAAFPLPLVAVMNSIILDGDWTFVTKNSVDFQGPKDRPGTRGQYADVAIHAGLICLNGPPGMDLDMQIELFEQALVELDADDDLVNKVLEVSLEDEDALRVLRYALPKD